MAVIKFGKNSALKFFNNTVGVSRRTTWFFMYVCYGFVFFGVDGLFKRLSVEVRDTWEWFSMDGKNMKVCQHGPLFIQWIKEKKT